MNALPHIGSTISQRAMLRHYKLQQRELEAERIAAERTDALLDSIREHDGCGCDECADEPPRVSPWIFWPLVVGFSLILTAAAYEFATRVLPVLRGWLS